MPSPKGPPYCCLNGGTGDDPSGVRLWVLGEGEPPPIGVRCERVGGDRCDRSEANSPCGICIFRDGRLLLPVRRIATSAGQERKFQNQYFISLLNTFMFITCNVLHAETAMEHTREIRVRAAAARCAHVIRPQEFDAYMELN